MDFKEVMAKREKAKKMGTPSIRKQAMLDRHQRFKEMAQEKQDAYNLKQEERKAMMEDQAAFMKKVEEKHEQKVKKRAQEAQEARELRSKEEDLRKAKVKAKASQDAAERELRLSVWQDYIDTVVYPVHRKYQIDYQNASVMQQRMMEEPLSPTDCMYMVDNTTGLLKPEYKQYEFVFNKIKG